MKLEKTNFIYSDYQPEVNVEVAVSHNNESKHTAVMAEVQQVWELIDGTVRYGSKEFSRALCIEPGESYEHNVRVYLHSAELVEKRIKLSASMAFYHQVLEKEISLNINEDPASYAGSTESFEFEGNRHTFNIRALVFAEDKDATVSIRECLVSEQDLSRDLVVLSAELFDASGNSRGGTYIDPPEQSAGKVLYWSTGCWGVKKKHLKGMRLKVLLKFLSAIPGSESSLTQEVTE